MILASELLDLMGASALSFTDIGGVAGLVQAGIFPDENSLYELLCLLDGYTLPDEAIDGFYYELAIRGYADVQVQAVIDTRLVEYITDYFVVPPELEQERDTLPETVGWFELTELGKKVVADSG